MLCRLCLHEKSDLHSIFNENLKIAEVIEQHLSIKPEPNDEMTTNICAVCWKRLKDFHDFYEYIKIAQLQYDYISMLETTIPIKLEKSEHEETEEMTMQVDIDPYNIQDRDKLYSKTQNPLEEINVIKEDDDNILSEENGWEGSDISELHETAAGSSGEEEDINKSVKTRKARKKQSNKKPKRLKTRSTKEKKRVTSSDNKLDPAVVDSLIAKHIPMGCDLCSFVGKSFTDIVEHFNELHPTTRPYLSCCDKRLTKRFYVAQHALIHENPDIFRCEQCNKSFKTSCNLRKHNFTLHAPEEELIFECNKCPKKFARRNLLEIHLPTHIPRDQWEYFCPLCPGSAYCSEYHLKIHKSMRHRNAANVCHVCAKEIRDKSAFERHVRSHFEESGPRIKCTFADCDSWLKDKDSLRHHLKGHNLNGQIFKCNVCDKECNNLRALTSHKSYSHSKQIFECQYCEKTFKKAITLKEHMTQHTGGTLYQCPFCSTTFNSNANMYAHKKKRHPVEWAESRKSSGSKVKQSEISPIITISDMLLSNKF